MKKGDNVFENIGNASKARSYQPAPGDQRLYELKCPVYFVGFMGAGKTTVSRRLARMVRLSCVDLDAFLERREGKTCAEIFAESGEDGFRDIETDVLSHFAYETDPMIVSCGGGIIKRSRNREILKTTGFVIYLQVTADEAAERIGDASSRPMFKNLEVARRTNEERKPLYLEVADAWVMTNRKSVWQIANEVEDILIKAEVLVPRADD
ncbi:MAG: shikimate kinase [Coriobacteriaceae bacterium]|nr:shikimate kinase [Coriobacteriaceae bacterium]